MSIAFKEWTLICDALGSGRQSILLRKGGIAEGRAGFQFKHEEFFLFPTLFHEQVSKLELPADTPLPHCESGIVRIEFLARVEWNALLTDLETARRLKSFHLWRDEVVEERFRYDSKNELHLAFVRIHRLQPIFEFPDEPKFGGCRSWVTIPDASPETGLQPVLSDAENAARSLELRKIIGLG